MPEDFWRTEDSEGAIIAFEMEAGSRGMPTSSTKGSEWRQSALQNLNEPFVTWCLSVGSACAASS